MEYKTSFNDERLASVEKPALGRFTMWDRVMLDLIRELRELRAIVAKMEPRGDVSAASRQ